MAKKKKQAVLLIHGIGEQRPMDTLRGFVKAVWTTDREVKHDYAAPGVFSKPDEISDSFELRRLTTTQNKEGVRTDFFEFYWAHLMEGTSVWHVVAWAHRLLWRSPLKVPKSLIGLWLMMVVLALVALFFAINSVLPDSVAPIHLPAWVTSVLGAVSAVLAIPVVKEVIGDAARYLDPAPGNIHRRQEIRAKGVQILRKLHESGEYDRIIVAGHSLGSVIGYDILTYSWPLFNEKISKRKAHPVLDALEADLGHGKPDPVEYQQKQRALQAEFIENQVGWLVTDFVTMGSPLTHAKILLADDGDDLAAKQKEREFPTCPPVLESGRFSYPDGAKHRTPHHAAVFGPTRWTNLYFKSSFFVHGDLVGGPLSEIFGAGIRDVKVRTTIRWGLLSHTLYWSQSRSRTRSKVTAESGDSKTPDEHIAALRKAINLLDR